MKVQCLAVVIAALSLAVINAQLPSYQTTQYDGERVSYVTYKLQRPQSLARPQQAPESNGGTPPPPPPPPPPSQSQPQFQYDAASFAVTDLARRIGTVLGQQTKAGVFSPVSIACALSLLLLAANGETKKELLQVFNFSPDKQQIIAIHHQYSQMLRDVASFAPDAYPANWRRTDRCSDEEDEDYRQEPQVIHLANAIFVKQGLPINRKFTEASWAFYNSTVSPQDFANNPQQSSYNVNKWASDNTYGKINQIVSNYLSIDTQMIVANALYFKGLWKEMFEKQATTYRKFYPDGYASPSTAKDVLTMAVIGCFPYYDAVEFDAKIVGLPYQGDKTALYIIVPNNSTRAKLQNFQSTLTGKDIGAMVLQMTVKKALIQMPKMKISNTINLRDVLQKLNLRTIFSPTASDLSGMLEPAANGADQYDRNRVVFGRDAVRQRLYASEIVHKVELDINEKGTEGGAVTASTIFRSLPSVQMRIDTPFLMLLGHDATRLPLFYGSIYDPSS